MYIVTRTSAELLVRTDSGAQQRGLMQEIVAAFGVTRHTKSGHDFLHGASIHLLSN
jgi:hypothetical protein